MPRNEDHTDTAVWEGKAGREETRPAGLGSGGWKRADRYRAGRLLHFLLTFAGPRTEAETIKQQVARFLHDDLKLELSPTKTLITHASTQAARFLGYELIVRYANDWIDSNGSRNINAAIALRLPREVLHQNCAPYERKSKPTQRSEWLRDSDFDLVARYQSMYRGLVQYYLLAHNVSWLNRLHWTMETSLLKTLAAKHKTTVSAMARQYHAETRTPYGTMKCLRVVVDRGTDRPPLVAQFGGIPLRRRKTATLKDQRPVIYTLSRTELITRLLADTCELCGSTEHCEVHHVRKLADLRTRGRAAKPLWIQRMAALRRKTLVVCRTCHNNIHAGGQPGKKRGIDDWRAV